MWPSLPTRSMASAMIVPIVSSPLALIVPTLRLFFVLKNTRRVVFVFVPLLPYIASVCGLMLAFVYFMAVLGLTMFEDVLKEALGDAARLEDVLEAMGGGPLHDHGH